MRPLLFMLWSVCAIAAYPAVLHAQEMSKKSEPLRVVLLGPFAPVGGLDVSFKGYERLRLGAYRFMANHPKVYELISDEALHERLRRRENFETTLELARDAASVGIQAYKDLQIDRARKNLKLALKIHRRIRQDVLAPKEVAQVILYLALSHLEGEVRDEITALNLFQEMLLLNPTRLVRAGFFPDNVVRVFERAKRELVHTLGRNQAPQAIDVLAQSMVSLMNAHMAFYGVVLRHEKGHHELLIYPYVRQGANWAWAPVERVKLLKSTPEALEAAANRLISSYTSCMYKPMKAKARVVPSTGQSPWSVQLATSYASFLKYPQVLDNHSYGNLGIGFGAQWLLTRDFGLVGGVHVLMAQQHYSNLFVENYFPMIRGFVGSEMGIRVKRWRFALQTNVDITHVSDFEIWGDKGCPPNPQMCTNQDKVIVDQYALMLGVNARPSVSFRIIESVEVLASTSMSYFFYTGDGQELNFPLSTELGIHYRF